MDNDRQELRELLSAIEVWEEWRNQAGNWSHEENMLAIAFKKYREAK